ncbi:phosphoribosyl-AMP cyclohydrolase [Aquisphaera giovannonii]|uniref:Phosphoribosyl-AMP cyclohydrolase n=1 Tax=Aquisphaera giovannonii TaxID=406548 RepID=A0A5B9W961_9BACT|nr:phosphoribosyl-AMP cyclohydrolase [Aquisphaera giovannonii]QEH37073.1 phosphoribosyl-AMP cyclohydrolase [Aquisphaera giovannonii]
MSTPKEPNVASDVETLPFLSTLRWDADGLIPAIVCDARTGEVLMMAWMNEDALRKTVELGVTHFYSRSRKALWRKGETSGHSQAVESIRVDCDADVLLVTVRQAGAACHEGYRTCFFRVVNGRGELDVTEAPVFDAAEVYGEAAVARGHALPGSEQGRPSA